VNSLLRVVAVAVAVLIVLRDSIILSRTGGHLRDVNDSCRIDDCRNSYGGERNRNAGQTGERRRQTGAQRHRANHAEPHVDVKPSDRDSSGGHGWFCIAMTRVCKSTQLQVSHLSLYSFKNFDVLKSPQKNKSRP